MENIIESLVPFGFYTAVILVAYFTTKFQYQLKKEILASGGNIELPRKKYPVLEIALTLTGIGLGLGLSLLILLQATDLQTPMKNLIVCSFALFFGGAGMVSGYFLRRRFENR